MTPALPASGVLLAPAPEEVGDPVLVAFDLAPLVAVAATAEVAELTSAESMLLPQNWVENSAASVFFEGGLLASVLRG